MRKKNKRGPVLVIVLIILILVGAAVFIYFKYNSESWNKVTRNPIAYMEYMGSYMSFDDEGFVISSSQTAPDDIPFVMGMDFEYVVVNEKLPIENNELFSLCIDVSRVLGDSEIDINRIQLSENDEIFLYTGDITVELGTRKNLENKLVQLKRIATLLKDYTAGYLDMRIYNENGEYTFTTKN